MLSIADHYLSRAGFLDYSKSNVIELMGQSEPLTMKHFCDSYMNVELMERIERPKN